ncbi:MAG: signal peptidase I [Armatimonadetes bacterium]|nr:signal peptidase I [Armatimonadota bacterium]
MPSKPTEPTAPATPTAQNPERRLLRFGLRAMFTFFALFLLLRLFVAEPFTIPTGSMKSTILEGDAVVVNKLPYAIRSPQTIPFTNISIPHFQLGGFGELERGDVVVFDPPGAMAAAGERYVKRCVAVAGDTVQLRGGRVWVNGSEVPPNPNDPLQNPAAADTLSARRAPVDSARANRYFGSQQQAMILPYEGYEITLDSANIAQWKSLIQSEGVSVEFRNSIVFLGGLPATRYTFRRNYFMALGDNSVNSFDSRFFGPIPYDHLVGQAWFIYWSGNENGEIRWSRIGSCVE